MNLSQKVAAEERVPNSFYEARNCLISKQDNGITRKKKCRLICLFRIDLKIHNKISQ